MKKEIVLYRRTHMFLRFISMFFAVLSILVTLLYTIDSIQSGKTVDSSILTFTVIIIIVAIYLNKFTCYSKEVLVAYNEKGFRKGDGDFIEWEHLKSWSIKTKKSSSNYSAAFTAAMILDTPLFASTYLGKHINTLKLNLDNNTTLTFPNEDIVDIMKFIKYLRKKLNQIIKLY